MLDTESYYYCPEEIRVSFFAVYFSRLTFILLLLLPLLFYAHMVIILGATYATSRTIHQTCWIRLALTRSWLLDPARSGLVHAYVTSVAYIREIFVCEERAGRCTANAGEVLPAVNADRVFVLGTCGIVCTMKNGPKCKIDHLTAQHLLR